MAWALIALALAILVAVPVGVTVLHSRSSRLERRVAQLEARLDYLRPAATVAYGAGYARQTRDRQDPTTHATRRFDADDTPSRTAIESNSAPAPGLSDSPAGVERLIRESWRWISEGNVPVKVGIVVLFAGVGALLKYATDQGWMSFPVRFRLIGIALVATAGLAFGWHQRGKRRTFALSLQGGAVGVLLMTSFAAFKLYALLPPAPAFLSWVLLAATAGALAVCQEARALAVLGILAGFMAPVLMSTGSGNHVVLFSFYAVLNTAIFGMAWRRSWRELNLLGFVFTFGIAIWWGVLQYSPEKLVTTLPFLGLFFAFYMLIPIIDARRGSVRDGVVAEASLVFGTPLISFALLARLLDGNQMQLAGSALGLAGLYALLAWRAVPPHASLLRQAHTLLAGGFATLAVPLALSAQATASVFALEGAALVWFGLAQGRSLIRWTGMALQVVAALCLLETLDDGRPTVAIANGYFTGALLLALAGFASAWCHDRARQANEAMVLHVWGLAWWVLMGAREIALFAADGQYHDLLLGFAAMTAASAALALRHNLTRELGWTVTVALAAAIPLAFGQAGAHQHPFAGHGLLAWIAFGALGAFALWRLRQHPGLCVACAHGAWLLAWPLAVTLCLHQLAGDAGLASGWRDAALILPWLVTLAGMLLTPRLVPWPLCSRFGGWRQVTLTVCALIVAGATAMLLLAPGDSAPMPWIPLINPLELSLVAALALLTNWLRDIERNNGPLPGSGFALSVGTLMVITSVTLRAVHHLGAEPWSVAILETASAQSSLSLVWSLLGVAGWILGSRRGHRGLWQVGAVLMGIVLLKLALVDRIHLGNLAGIASFIGYGLLCILVGYLAPAPPRTAPA